MYRITVKTCGKYENVMPGDRYCFRKKSAFRLVKLFLDAGCVIDVKKFIHLTGDVFCWGEVDNVVFNYFYDRTPDYD